MNEVLIEKAEQVQGTYSELELKLQRTVCETRSSAESEAEKNAFLLEQALDLLENENYHSARRMVEIVKGNLYEVAVGCKAEDEYIKLNEMEDHNFDITGVEA